MNLIHFLTLCAISTATALKLPTLRAQPRQSMPPPEPEPSPTEANALRATAALWLALVPPSYTNPQPIIETVFGLPSTSFEDRLKEPAGGFLEITSPLFVLEAGLLFALAGSLSATASNLSAKDRSRVGAAVHISSGGALATFGLTALAETQSPGGLLIDAVLMDDSDAGTVARAIAA